MQRYLVTTDIRMGFGRIKSCIPFNGCAYDMGHTLLYFGVVVRMFAVQMVFTTEGRAAGKSMYQLCSWSKTGENISKQ